MVLFARIITALLFVSALLPGVAAASYREHAHGRRHVRYEYRTYQPMVRTTTHALHPLYRNRYHDVITVRRGSRAGDAVRRAYFGRQIIGPVYSVPISARCEEYRYYRRHNRFPPQDFECLRR